MSYERVKQYFKQYGLEQQITVHKEITNTVEQAAQVIGCEPERIVKTMSFMTKEGPILVAVAGDAKISNPKFRETFQQKAKMIHEEEVEKLIGHIPGGVCPFAVNDNVNVYLDVSLKRFTDIHTAAGNTQSTIYLTMDELTEHSHLMKWVDVCKDWMVNEGLIDGNAKGV